MSRGGCSRTPRAVRVRHRGARETETARHNALCRCRCKRGPAGIEKPDHAKSPRVGVAARSRPSDRSWHPTPRPTRHDDMAPFCCYQSAIGTVGECGERGLHTVATYIHPHHTRRNILLARGEQWAIVQECPGAPERRRRHRYGRIAVTRGQDVTGRCRWGSVFTARRLLELLDYCTWQDNFVIVIQYCKVSRYATGLMHAM